MISLDLKAGRQTESSTYLFIKWGLGCGRGRVLVDENKNPTPCPLTVVNYLFKFFEKKVANFLLLYFACLHTPRSCAKNYYAK